VFKDNDNGVELQDGCWLLVAGCELLLLAIGDYCIYRGGYKMQDTRCRIPDAEYQMQDAFRVGHKAPHVRDSRSPPERTVRYGRGPQCAQKREKRTF
jgi:hypothetical protein